MQVNYFGPNSAVGNATLGMQRGQAQVTDASVEIAQQPLRDQTRGTEETGLSPDALTRELINLNEGEMVFSANARSMEAAQSMFDSLLAIRPQNEEIGA
ncbi:hypothetical protein ACR0ST_11520 [Aliidiomarina sp. Khilg15.8]